MKSVRSVRARRKVRGLSLIEVLIALAIGLVVVAAVIVSFIGSGKAGRTQSALSQMNQDAQIGLNLLSREIQLAGYSAPASVTNPSGSVPAVWVVSYHNLTTATGYVTATTAYIFGCDAGTNRIAPFGANPRADPLVCGAVSGATSSGLSVVYEADAKNTVPSGGVPTDCLGTALTSRTNDGGLTTYYIARNRYFIDVSSGVNSSGRPELYCASPDSAKQPLLENIEDMQIWYGLSLSNIDATAASRQVVRYVKAASVAAADWDKVMSVRICLLVRSAEPVLSSDGEDTLTYQPCDPNAARATSNDRYLRRAYYTTSTLRSKMTY